MSEQEQFLITGRAVMEYVEARNELAALQHKAKDLSEEICSVTREIQTVTERKRDLSKVLREMGFEPKD